MFDKFIDFTYDYPNLYAFLLGSLVYSGIVTSILTIAWISA
jgi:hypothetical protein